MHTHTHTHTHARARARNMSMHGGPVSSAAPPSLWPPPPLPQDVKPRNILVLSVNPLRIALADFGLATEHCITFTEGVGTSVYMAPEVADPPRAPGAPCGGGYTAKADMYSCAVTIMDILTGCPDCEWPELAAQNYHGPRRLQERLKKIKPHVLDDTKLPFRAALAAIDDRGRSLARTLKLALGPAETRPTAGLVLELANDGHGPYGWFAGA
jgi:hypothetical protein